MCRLYLNFAIMRLLVTYVQPLMRSSCWDKYWWYGKACSYCGGHPYHATACFSLAARSFFFFFSISKSCAENSAHTTLLTIGFATSVDWKWTMIRTFVPNLPVPWKLRAPGTNRPRRSPCLPNSVHSPSCHSPIRYYIIPAAIPPPHPISSALLCTQRIQGLSVSVLTHRLSPSRFSHPFSGVNDYVVHVQIKAYLSMTHRFTPSPTIPHSFPNPINTKSHLSTPSCSWTPGKLRSRTGAIVRPKGRKKERKKESKRFL